jgi:LacI family transcriptional regulator
MATMKDVARRAGVSTATVSHVVNESRSVGAETRKRVREAIDALKYRPDGIARSLRVSQTGTIAVLISDIANPFFAEFVRGVEEATHAKGEKFNLLLCNTEENNEHERRALELVLEKRIDGIIIAPVGGNHAFISDLIEGGVPIVFGDRFLKGVPADSVGVNNREASAEIVQHLIGLGHRRIAVLGAELNASSIRERIAGYRDALSTAGLPIDAELEQSSPSALEAAFEAGCRLLDCPVQPDAVFCTNNFMTLGMVRALLERGLQCPGDMAVVGFDDFPWAASFHPRLTVVAQPANAMGRESARLLFDRLAERRTGPAIRVLLDTKLIVRDSCGSNLARS